MKKPLFASENDSANHAQPCYHKRTSRIIILVSVSILTIFFCSVSFADQQLEFCNNFLMNLSFVTGTDRGMEQNLDDNFGWMQNQGYTQLRFFGIFSNRLHCFPSPTLDANGYPNSPYHEQVLQLLMASAREHGITVNFDGWEVIAEANYDTASAGVGYITVEELGNIVEEVLAFDVDMISEEQFGSGYLQEIQSVCSDMGAGHETTAALWWQSGSTASIADMQLVNVFSFYPGTQAEADSAIAAGNPFSLNANLGSAHFMLEGCRYFNIPTSLAVGSFGTLEAENWGNVLRFVQIQHHPGRFSIEEQNTAYTIWDPNFNFMNYVGNDLVSLGEIAMGERPIANLIINAASISTPSFLPAWYASQIDAAAIVNTFASEGYRVVATVDSALADADAYYVLLAGGPGSPNVADLPDYVPGLLAGDKTVFVQPAYGIPDDNDGGGWAPLRQFFGLPPGETETMAYSVPDTVDFNGFDVKWGGVKLYLTPCLELLRPSEIDIAQASVELSAEVGQDDVALILQHENKFLVNSNLVNIDAAYIFSTLLSGPLNCPAAADMSIADGKCLIFAEYDTQVDVDLPWTGNTRLIRYDPAGEMIYDIDTILSGTYFTSMSRGELVILAASDNYLCGDANGDGNINVSDAVYIINYIFIGGNPPDPLESGNANCDSSVNVSDAVWIINYVFIGGNEPCDTDGDQIPDC